MLDFHTHILPCIDDGSKSLEESVLLLEQLFLQGVRTVCATPHFYAQKTSPSKFIKSRDSAWEALKPLLTDKMPRVILGAEVHYYEGMCRTEELDKLKLSGTNLLLVEMPYKPWTSREISAISELSDGNEFTVVLAHIERYFACADESVLDELLQNGVLMQANASFFKTFLTKNKALKMLASNQIHFLGTDAHNMTSRKPCMNEALYNITKKLGPDYIKKLSRMEAYMQSENQNTFNTVGPLISC